MRKPVELKDLDLRVLQELLDDIYNKFGLLFYNTAVADIDVSGMAGDALTNANKVNSILAMLRTAGILSEE